MIEEYQALWNKADTSPSGMRALIQLADIDTALGRVSDDAYPAVLLVGLLGMTQAQAAAAMHISPSAVNHLYQRGLNEIQHYINGGEDE